MATTHSFRTVTTGYKLIQLPFSHRPRAQSAKNVMFYLDLRLYKCNKPYVSINNNFLRIPYDVIYVHVEFLY